MWLFLANRISLFSAKLSIASPNFLLDQVQDWFLAHSPPQPCCQGLLYGRSRAGAVYHEKTGSLPSQAFQERGEKLRREGNLFQSFRSGSKQESWPMMTHASLRFLVPFEARIGAFPVQFQHFCTRKDRSRSLSMKILIFYLKIS